MKIVKNRTCWAAQWHSKNKLDGERKHLITEDLVPKLFPTKWQCERFIRTEFGYIAKRKDLRREPHGWRMPKPVKVTVQVAE